MRNLIDLKRGQIKAAKEQLEKQGKKLEDYPWPEDQVKEQIPTPGEAVEQPKAE